MKVKNKVCFYKQDNNKNVKTPLASKNVKNISQFYEHI